MIIDRDLVPEKNIYYLGGKVLEVLRDHQYDVVSPIEIFHQLERLIPTKVSFDYFLLALDWLFILSKIEVDKKGDIVKCF